MYAILRDKSGTSIEVEILEAHTRSLLGGEDGPRVSRYELQSRLPVTTPEHYLLAMPDGAIVEPQIVVSEALPNGRYFLLGLVLERQPSLAG